MWMTRFWIREKNTDLAEQLYLNSDWVESFPSEPGLVYPDEIEHRCWNSSNAFKWSIILYLDLMSILNNALGKNTHCLESDSTRHSGQQLSYLQTCFAGLFGIAALGLVHWNWALQNTPCRTCADVKKKNAFQTQILTGDVSNYSLNTCIA